MFNLSNVFDNIVALMKTFKLLLRSLISNNACIDGGRKKPWYFAVIIFFLSLATALVPITVGQAKIKGTNALESTTYGAREAFTAFAEELNKPEYANSMYVIKGEKKNDRLLVGGDFTRYEHPNDTTGKPDFIFMYDQVIDQKKYAEEITKGYSVVYFSKDSAKIYIANPVKGGEVDQLDCPKAYKKFDEGYRFASSYKLTEGNPTKTIYKTWEVWHDNIDDFYNAKRVMSTWTLTGMFAGIDTMIALLMAFMVWVLTKGKHNAYNKTISFWQAMKLTAWTMISPAILGLGLGFLIKSFATAIFPLLLGIRAMWLTMKSFKPDGTGYVESND